MNPELAKALLAVQKDAPKIQSDGINPHFKSKYVTLESLMGTILPVLNKHGVVLIQAPTSDGNLNTTLIHADTGEERGSSIPLMLSRDDAQGQGSAITYARRYALMSMLGLVADEDDDGNQASRPVARTMSGGPPREKPKAEFDPGKDLLPGAIAVRGEDDAVTLQQVRGEYAPGANWTEVDRTLAQAVFGQDAPTTPAQWGEWWKRLANAIVRAQDIAESTELIETSVLEDAFAWAFKGAVVALGAPEVPAEDVA